MVSALGQQLTTTEDMLQEATCFYQQLFSLMETHRIQYDFITLFEPTLNLVEQNKLETPLLRTKFISNFNKLKIYCYWVRWYLILWVSPALGNLGTFLNSGCELHIGNRNIAIVDAESDNSFD